MSTNNERKTATKAVCKCIEQTILPAGFHKQQAGLWFRQLPWHWELVGVTASPRWMVVTLQLEFYKENGDPHGPLFDARNLSYLGGYPTGSYDVPDAPGGFEPAVGAFAAVAEKVCQDVPLILPWFERFSTPEKCLREMRSRDKNHNFGPPGSPPYYRCEKYLLHLLNGGSPPETKQLIP